MVKKINFKTGKKKGLELSQQATKIIFILAELLVLSFLILVSSFQGVSFVMAGFGADNVTLDTIMDIGNSFPEVLNITVNGGNAIDLSPNSTALVEFYAVIRDFSGEDDINNFNVTFFDISSSTFGSNDDRNDHYTNSSCVINTAYGDSFEANVTCTIPIYYYANNATWNSTVIINDSLNAKGIGSSLATVNTLLALGLPDNLNYGLVNATEVSSEGNLNVTNFGNVAMNLSLSGYSHTEGDGNALNCTLGSVQNISVENMKYNVTSSLQGNINLTEAQGNYSDLSSSPVVNEFNLNYRQNDVTPHLDEMNATYWRLYVPLGVAGNCTGNLVFGAVQAPVT